MSNATSISWTDISASPWEGCTKVSEGCAHCYAEARDRRHLIEKVSHWGPGAPRRKVLGFAETVRKANARAEREGRRIRIFPSVCDPFDHEAPLAWFVEFLEAVRTSPNLEWQILTKRPQFWRQRLNMARLSLIGAGGADLQSLSLCEWITGWLRGHAPRNVWIGASMENQQRANERMAPLLSIPAAVRFVSVEPMLGETSLIDAVWNHVPEAVMVGIVRRTEDPNVWTSSLLPGLHWVIVGGESGPGARPMAPNWARKILEECRAARVPFYMKQMGGVKKRDAWEDLPAGLRTREFPEVTP